MKRSSEVGVRSSVGLVCSSLIMSFASACARPLSTPKTERPAVIVDGSEAETEVCPKLRAEGEAPLIDDFDAKGSRNPRP
ncbi:MAG: hypothetical protein QM784_09680 [Polyangiaceae bacterium]